MVESNKYIFVSKITINYSLKLRAGKIITPHGSLITPLFFPDATRGFIKLTDNQAVKQAAVPALVVNTLHLYLQPGLKIIKQAGGLHRFMSWDQPLLSDSGGFQVFSLIHKNKNLGKITDEQVEFRSPLDGSKHILSPEKSIQIQFDLGTDLMVCLDDCPPNEASSQVLEKAVERTISWAKRCQLEYKKQISKRRLTDKQRPLLLAVVQGGADHALRQQCARALIDIGFDGYGFGARPVDQAGNFLASTLAATAQALPKNSLRFALGIGLPEDIFRSYLMGWDAFDCVIPTREGRHGRLFYFSPRFTGFKKLKKIPSIVSTFPNFYHPLNIKQAKFSQDFSAINPQSQLPELRLYSKAFLHHLFRLNDPLGQRLASLNNLEFFQNLLNYLRLINK